VGAKPQVPSGRTNTDYPAGGTGRVGNTRFKAEGHIVSLRGQVMQSNVSSLGCLVCVGVVARRSRGATWCSLYTALPRVLACSLEDVLQLGSLFLSNSCASWVGCSA